MARTIPQDVMLRALKAAAQHADDARHNVYTIIPHLDQHDEVPRGNLLEALGKLQRSQQCIIDALELLVIAFRQELESSPEANMRKEAACVGPQTAPAPTLNTTEVIHES